MINTKYGLEEIVITNDRFSTLIHDMILKTFQYCNDCMYSFWPYIVLYLMSW